MKKVFFFLVVIAMAASCSRSSINERELFANADTITVDLDNPIKLELNRIIDSVSFVRLETNKNCMVGKIDEILFMDSTMIVVDQRTSRAAFVFDYDGQYISKLSNLGNGPKEYLDITYVFKMSDSVVAIQDRIKKKVFCFNRNGEFLYDFRASYVGGDMEYIDENTYVHDVRGVGHIEGYNEGDYAYVTSDKGYHMIYGIGRNTYSKKMNYTQGKHLYRYNDTIYGVPNFEKVVYQLGPNCASAKYVLDIVSADVMDFDYKTSEDVIKLEQQYPFFKGEFIELDNYSFFRIRNKRGWYHVFYDHNSGVAYTAGYSYNHPFVLFFNKPYLTDSGNCLVTSETAPALLRYKEQFYDGASVEIRKDLDLLYNDMKVDDNPVLFFYHLKDKIAE